jgi:uncharacterized membrane protein
MGREEVEIQRMEKDLDLLRAKLLEKHPSHFSRRDVVNTFFGSLLIGLTFILKGALIRTAEALSETNVVLVIISTIAILTIEIYYIGYSRVSKHERKHRKFGQFWAKRLFTLYGIALLVSLYLVYVFGINKQFSDPRIMYHTVVLLSMPCAVGAAIPHLLKKF